MKLEKVNKELYATKDTKYTLKKDYKSYNGRMRRVWRLFKDGSYIAMPQTIADANEIIKQHEAEENR